MNATAVVMWFAFVMVRKHSGTIQYGYRRSMNANDAGRDFPVVCVGGSAGGLDAYIRLLRHLPAGMGVAIVISNHVRTFATLLHQILPAHTAMTVELTKDRLLIQPNRLLIIAVLRERCGVCGSFRVTPL